MPNIFHKNYTLDNIHTDIARIYADIAARDADIAFNEFTTNINKNVLITSPPSVFKLISILPDVWLEYTSTLTDSFLELIDTPSSYSGFGLNGVRVNAGETGLEFTPGDAGDVVGPATATDFALCRFDTTSGKLIQNSVGILTDAGALSGLAQITVGALQFESNALTTTAGNLILSPFGSNNIDASTSKIINVVDPTADQDGATKKYVDDQILTIDTWAEVLANGATSGGSSPIISTGDDLLVSDHMSVGAATAPATDSSIDLKATDAAFLFNRVDSTTRDGLTAIAGMGIWNTTTVQMENFDGVAWVPMGGGDVSGPATNLDNSIPTWNGVNSKLLQDQGTMFITDAGLVGIGIALPDSKLHSFVGSAGTITAIAGTNLTLESNTNQYLSFLNPSGNFAAIAFGIETDNDHGGIFYDSTNGFQFRNNGNLNRVCIEQNGNVGIGTASPDVRLHVLIGASGAPTTPGGTTLTLESNTNNFITMQQPDADGGGILFQYPTGGVRGAFSYSTNDDWFWSTINNTVKMTLESTGQLRIGDATAPTATLDISGSHANSRTAIADANHTVVAGDYLLAVTSITAPRTIDFPTTEIAKTGKEWPIKDESGNVDGTLTITLTTEGSETIDGAASLVLNTAFFDLVIYTDGTNLFVRSA